MKSMSLTVSRNPGSIIRRYRLWIILSWAAIFVLSLTGVGHFLSSVNYNITAPSGSSSNSATQAQNIINSEFPAMENSSGGNNLLVVVQDVQPYSNELKDDILGLNQTLTQDASTTNYTGMSSLYVNEYGGLNSIVPNLLPAVRQTAANISASKRNITSSQAWSLASMDVGKEAAIAYSENPLFSINGTSMGLLLSDLSSNITGSQFKTVVLAAVSNQSVFDYPLIPTQTNLRNFVSANNQTIVFSLDLATYPTGKTLEQIDKAVNESGLLSLGSVYITGAAPVVQGVENTLTPALVVVVGVALLASLLVVGFLFLAPMAALVPLIMGGLSITIAFSAIYFGLVKLDHQTLSFLTPTTTSLLLLGLSVDYSVLQLRRTREERLKGASIADSIDYSVKWAGQAVLTAGITVIVAYIVVWAANVPLFGSVGAAIAIGVAILLAMSLTLLPSLEAVLGDRMFWPRFRHGVVRASMKSGRSRLERIAEDTLRRKVAVASIISLVALGSFVEFHQTPTGEDLLDLLPSSSSLQGLAVYTSSFGIGSVQIVITTPTPIVDDAGQFNQTLLNEIQEITNAVLSTNGVSGVVGLTAPFGVPFTYQSMANFSAPIRAIYESQMMSLTGLNNATTLIDVSLSNSEMSAAAVNSLYGMEKNIQSLGLQGLSVYYAGTTASTSASDTSLAELLPEIVLLLAAAIYVILFVQLRSVFIPLRLIFTILCSVAMSLAVMSLLFYHALNLPIFDLAPLFAVVTMMGVGIDYDIFFVTRIREEVLNGKSDDDAIKTAVEKMWVTIFGMGLVLFCVFGAEATVKIPLLQEIGFTVAAAIIVDTTAVILLFVPALMGLVQDLNWWPTKIKKKAVGG